MVTIVLFLLMLLKTSPSYIYVTDGLFCMNGTACLSPFSVKPWIMSDKGLKLRSDALLFLIFRN